MTNDTAIVALKALDGLAARAEVTAQNIANANSVGYRALRLSFEEALTTAARKGPDAVRELTFDVEPVPKQLGSSSMRLDLELQTASATALRYTAVASVLNRMMQMQASAITGGR